MDNSAKHIAIEFILKALDNLSVARPYLKVANGNDAEQMKEFDEAIDILVGLTYNKTDNS